MNPNTSLSKPRVPDMVFMPAALDACALYRMFIPHVHVTGSRYVFRRGKIVDTDFAGTEVAVVQRLGNESNLMALQIMQEAGCKVIYDLDDNLWAVPKYNPAKYMIDSMQAGFNTCASAADLITVSTAGLKSAVEANLPKLKTPVLVVPNGIDLALFHKAPERDSDSKIVVGYAGSNTHKEDVAQCWNVIGEALEGTNAVFELIQSNVPVQQVKMVGGIKVTTTVVQKDPNGVPRGLKEEQLRIRPWIPVPEFAGQFSSWQWDIALAPLEDNRFNRSKSNIKMLEAAAVGAVCLASPVQPYLEFCEHHPAAKWLLCYTERQWKEKLRTLINDKDARLMYADIIYRIAKNYYSADITARIWEDAAREVMMK